MLVPADGDPSLSARGTGSRDMSDAFSIDGLVDGKYAFTNPNGRTMSVSVNGRALAFPTIEIAGRDITDVVVTFSKDTTTVEGQVRAGDNRNEIVVLAFPAERNQWRDYGFDSPRFARVRPAEDGRYRITSLPAGDYFLIATDFASAVRWPDPAFLDAAAAGATRVAVPWNGTSGASLTVQPVRVR